MLIQNKCIISKFQMNYSFGEIRVTHEQNLVLPHVKNTNLLSYGKN